MERCARQHVPAAPAASLLIRCCPNLRYLNRQHLQYSVDQLTQLQGLGALHTLRLAVDGPIRAECLLAVCHWQLAGLRELRVSSLHATRERPMLQLTQLRLLTKLVFEDPWSRRAIRLVNEVRCT